MGVATHTLLKFNMGDDPFLLKWQIFMGHVEVFADLISVFSTHIRGRFPFPQNVHRPQ